MQPGFVVLSAADTDVPATGAICTVSKDEPGDDGGFAIGVAAAQRGAIFIDRAYWTGNPTPEWLAGKCDDALEAGASWAQCGNELNLELEGFQGGPAAYFALEDAVRSLVVDPARLLAMPPSPGVPGWEQWVRSAGDHACHAYGSCAQMQATVQWFLDNTSGRVVVTECNWGAGNAVDVEQWAGAELVPFLDWCHAQPRVVACLYFAWVWRGAPPMPTPVDAKGTAIERVVVDWVPPAGGGAETWYPAAVRRPISCNYTPGRGGQHPGVIVDHVADGLGSPYGWFNTRRGEAGSSAHFWVSRAGAVEQYRPLEDTCWANGPIADPDLSNPSVAAIVASGVDPNQVTVAVEHENYSGDPFLEPQVAASAALHQWLSEQLGIALDRDAVIGHYQLDAVTRPNCPGPTFPWDAVLAGAPLPDDLAALQDRTWAACDQLQALAGEWEANGWPSTSSGIAAAAEAAKSLVRASKNER